MSVPCTEPYVPNCIFLSMWSGFQMDSNHDDKVQVQVRYRRSAMFKMSVQARPGTREAAVTVGGPLWARRRRPALAAACRDLLGRRSGRPGGSSEDYNGFSSRKHGESSVRDRAECTLVLDNGVPGCRRPGPAGGPSLNGNLNGECDPAVLWLDSDPLPENMRMWARTPRSSTCSWYN